jgi:hypothetical protein
MTQPSPADPLAPLLALLGATFTDADAQHVRIVREATRLGAFDEAALAALAGTLSAVQAEPLGAILARELSLLDVLARRALDCAAEQPDWLTQPALLTDDPDRAREAQALAADALWSRELADRLTRLARTLDVSVPELDSAIAHELKGASRAWTGMQVLVSRLAASAPPHRREAWWFAPAPDPADLLDGDLDPPGSQAETTLLSDLAAWVQSHTAPSGVLCLSADEAAQLLATPHGLMLTEALRERLDLTALETQPEPQAEARPAPRGVDQAPSPPWRVTMPVEVGQFFPIAAPPPVALHAPSVVAMAAGPDPVCGSAAIAVLLSTGSARILQLRVALSDAPGDPFAGAALLGPDARAAIRMGFFAAMELVTHKLPPAMLEFHRITVGGDTAGLAVVDGASLGASSAMAFLSLWTGKTPSRGSVSCVLSSKGSLRPVSGVSAKALAAMEADEGPLLVLAEQAAEAEGLARGVTTLAEVARALGLLAATADAADVTLAEATKGWSVNELRLRIASGSDSVARQELAPADAWDVAAARLVVLGRTLAALAPHDPAVAAAKLGAAHAYLHAAQLDEASTLLSSVSEPLDARPELRSFLTLLRATKLADSLEAWDHAVTQALSDLRELAAAGAQAPTGSVPARLRCSALGTAARLHAHRARDPADLATAYALASEAVDEWGRLGFAEEVPRALSQLALCARRQGRSLDAVAIAEEGLAHLPATQAFSPAYAESTAVFLGYELGRSLVAAGDAEGGVDLLQRTLWACERRESLAKWPWLGIARSLVHGLARRNRPTDAAERERLQAAVAARAAGTSHPVLEAVAANAASAIDTTVY